MKRFLHLKFAGGRPPAVAAGIPWAHELDPTRDVLHETLSSDVQREGVIRYLQQNFPPGSYVHDVVHEREADAGMFILCTKNWARSVGDPKLHLSLYVYQEDSHCATWHAYTDRSISYSREGDEADPPAPGHTDPYTTSEALAAATSRTVSPMPPPQDDGRPRFDRPAAAPDSDEGGVEEPFQPDEVLSSQSAVTSQPTQTAPTTRSKRRPKPGREDRFSEAEVEQIPSGGDGRTDDEDQAASTTSRQGYRRGSRSARRRSTSIDEQSDELENANVDLSKPAYPIHKSKPLGRDTARSDGLDLSQSTSSLHSTRPSRSARRARPVSPDDARKDRQSRSPSTSRSPSRTQGRATLRDEPSRDDNKRRSRHHETARDQLSRSPSPAPQIAKKPHPHAPRTAHSPSPSCDESETTAPLQSSRLDTLSTRSGDAERSKKKAARPPSPYASPHRSPSPSPERRSLPKARSARSNQIDTADEASERGRSPSKSPSPVRGSRRPSRSSPRRSSQRKLQSTDAGSEEANAKSERRGRSSARSAVMPAPTAPPLERAPSWRSISRNRYRREDSDEDTLVRGNLDDHELDIPAGGEATLLEAKRRSAAKDRAARPAPRVRDEGFDPAVVARPPPVPPKQTAKDVLGGWIKSVAALVKTEGELVTDEVEEKVYENDVEVEEAARLRRKEERMQRRAARAARRAARAEAEAQVDDAVAEDARTARKAPERASDLRHESKRHGEAYAVTDDVKSGGHEHPEHENDARAGRRRTSSRRREIRHTASDEDVSPEPADMPHRSYPVKAERTRVRSSRHPHHNSSNFASPVELEDDDDEAEPVRSAGRSRAMSVSATVESGLRGLRDSVAKMVSGAQAVEHEVEEEARRASSAKKAGRDDDRQKSRLIHRGSDEESAPPRHQRRSRRPSVAVETDGEYRRNAGRDRAPTQYRTSVPARSQQEKTVQSPDSRSAAPPHSVRGARQSRPERSESSDSHGPPAVLQHDPRLVSGASDTEISEPTTRPSSRMTVRSESEGDQPVHRLAKVNAALNAASLEPEKPPPGQSTRVRSANARSQSIQASTAANSREDRASRLGHRQKEDKSGRIELTGADRIRSPEASHQARDQARTQARDYDDEPRNTRRRARRGSEEEALRDDRRFTSDRRQADAHLASATQRVPPIPSPVSPDSSGYLYAYDGSADPIRPHPVYPSLRTGTAPEHPSRRVPPPSSVGSSDEGDPSRPVKQIRRVRSGYPADLAQRMRGDGSRAASSVYTHGTSDSDSDAPGLREHRRERKRFDRSPSPSPSPSPPSTLNKRHSFSRTGGSYPFSGDDSSSNELSSSSNENKGTSIRPRHGRNDGMDSRTRNSMPYPPRDFVAQPYDASTANVNGVRTMVSAAAAPTVSRWGSRTTVSSTPQSHSSQADREQQQQQSRDWSSPYPRYDADDGAPSPVRSRSHRRRPASPQLPTVYGHTSTQLISQEGPSSSTSFDARRSHREVDDPVFEWGEHERDQRMRARLLKQGMASGSAQLYGQHGAPVGRRMARKLGL